MLYTSTLISILEVLIVTIPVLLTVAFVTVAERKTMASMQRRLGPNIVGYYGSLQAFADALKLLLKEYVSPTQANIVLFFLGPIITLIFSLLGYAVIPYGPGLAIWDFDLGILYMLAVSSLATYGILLAGWSANSKYAFLGSLRSTAQLISYELILSSAILLVILLTGSLNLTTNIESQRAIWFIVPLFPIFMIFFIGSVAETNRAPFDLAEAESELVSGFMTEHSAVIFVFFFLAEYASIVLMCILTSILFLGGYLSPLGSDHTYISMVLTYVVETFFFAIDWFFTLIEFAIWGYGDIPHKPVFDASSYTSTTIPSRVTSVMAASETLMAEFKDRMASDYPASDLSLHKSLITPYEDVVTIINSHEHRMTSDYLAHNIHAHNSHKSVMAVSEALMAAFKDITGYVSYSASSSSLEATINGLILGLKTSLMVFTFIWVRASFPRIRFDQLMSFSWTVLLPIIVAFIILIPCIIYSFDIIPCNINLL